MTETAGEKDSREKVARWLFKDYDHHVGLPRSTATQNETVIVAEDKKQLDDNEIVDEEITFRGRNSSRPLKTEVHIFKPESLDTSAVIAGKAGKVCDSSASLVELCEVRVHILYCGYLSCFLILYI